jgi:hypothetical protein
VQFLTNAGRVSLPRKSSRQKTELLLTELEKLGGGGGREGVGRGGNLIFSLVENTVAAFLLPAKHAVFPKTFY